MSLEKREDIGTLKRKQQIAIGAELALRRGCKPVVRQNVEE
jgi:hypothetical protein